LVLPSKFLDLRATNPKGGKNLFQSSKIVPTNSAQILLHVWPLFFWGAKNKKIIAAAALLLSQLPSTA